MIIKAGIEDAKVLSEMGAETFIASHRNSAPAHEIDRYVKETYNVEAITEKLTNPQNIYHIIKHENRYAGFSKMILNSSYPGIAAKDVSKMDQIYLLNTFQGLKLGAKLLQFNIGLSRTSKEAGMWLIVWLGNTQAMNFYIRFGFTVVKEDVFYLTETHTNRCYIMFHQYGNDNAV